MQRGLTDDSATARLARKWQATLAISKGKDVTDPPRDERPPLALAMEWLAKVTTVVSEMVLPGVFGFWLDKSWKTSYCGLIGVALGFTVGLAHLIQMAKTMK